MEKPISTQVTRSVLCEQRLLRSLKTVVHLIECGNEDLWPIFEKLDGEFLLLQQRKNRLANYVS